MFRQSLKNMIFLLIYVLIIGQPAGHLMKTFSLNYFKSNSKNFSAEEKKIRGYLSDTENSLYNAAMENTLRFFRHS